MNKKKEVAVCKFFVADDIIEILSCESIFNITKRVRKGEFTLSELNDLLYTFVTEGFIDRKTFLKFIYKIEGVCLCCAE